MGDISLTSREIKTKNGGDISLFAPGGGITVGFDVGANQASDQGILTEHGGNISMYSRDSVTLGTSGSLPCGAGMRSSTPPWAISPQACLRKLCKRRPRPEC